MTFMRKLIVIGLLAAIGAIAFIERADAAGVKFCASHPDAKKCYAPPRPLVYRPAFLRHDNRFQQDGRRFAPLPGAFAPSPIRCDEIAYDLRSQGFTQVHALSCVGANYIYSAVQDGTQVNITVDKRFGRIRRVYPST